MCVLELNYDETVFFVLTSIRRNPLVRLAPHYYTLFSVNPIVAVTANNYLSFLALAVVGLVAVVSSVLGLFLNLIN